MENKIQEEWCTYFVFFQADFIQKNLRNTTLRNFRRECRLHASLSLFSKVIIFKTCVLCFLRQLRRRDFISYPVTRGHLGIWQKSRGQKRKEMHACGWWDDFCPWIRISPFSIYSFPARENLHTFFSMWGETPPRLFIYIRFYFCNKMKEIHFVKLAKNKRVQLIF